MEKEKNNFDVSVNFLKDGKLTRDGKNEINNRWKNTFGDKSYDEIEKELPSVLNELTDSDLDKKIKKSFKLRAKAVRRRELAIEIKSPDSEWNDFYKTALENNPKARATDIAAEILNLMKVDMEISDKPINKQLVKSIKTEEIIEKPKTKKEFSAIDGLFVFGLFATIAAFGNLLVTESQTNRLQQADKAFSATPKVVEIKPTVLYDSSNLPVDGFVRTNKTDLVSPTETPTTIGSIKNEQNIEHADPFKIGKIDFRKPVHIYIPGTGVDFVNNPKILPDSEYFDSGIINNFNQVKDPNETLVTVTDIRGMMHITAHDFYNYKSQALPLEGLRKKPMPEMLNNSNFIFLDQETNGEMVMEMFIINYAKIENIKTYSESFGQSVNGPMLRTDLTTGDGTKRGINLPDYVRKADSLVIDSCFGNKINSSDGSGFDQRMIYVAERVS